VGDMEEGKSCLNKGDYDGALRHFQKALEIDPKDSRVLNGIFGIGSAYFMEQNYDRAIGCYKKVLEFDPENSDALSEIWYIYYERGDYRKEVT